MPRKATASRWPVAGHSEAHATSRRSATSGHDSAQSPHRLSRDAHWVGHGPGQQQHHFRTSLRPTNAAREMNYMDAWRILTVVQTSLKKGEMRALDGRNLTTRIKRKTNRLRHSTRSSQARSPERCSLGKVPPRWANHRRPQQPPARPGRGASRGRSNTPPRSSHPEHRLVGFCRGRSPTLPELTLPEAQNLCPKSLSSKRFEKTFIAPKGCLWVMAYSCLRVGLSHGTKTL